MQNNNNIKGTLQNLLDLSNGTGKTKVFKNGSGYAVYILDSKRLYNIDKNGDITNLDNNIMVSDSNPGRFEEIPFIPSF